ncbi:hypothetical protein BC629DRAFT_1735458 [Irpex lacteus]|nr:hypothetical protein BC629DRAFT_1735458 [Irpex lacteus]
MFCPDDANRRSLRLDKRKVSNVHVLGENLQFVQGSLIIAECPQCNSIYYPDKITYKDPVQRGRNKRRQRLEGDATYLCISKSGIWAHRRVALMQEKAVHRFTAGWSNFAYFLSDLSNRKVTKHQAKKLFVEHFARRLLVAHVIMIGQNGGILPNALTHGCQDCTHEKRTREDLTREGVILAQGPDAIEQVVGVPYAGGANGAPQNGNPQNLANGDREGIAPAPLPNANPPAARHPPVDGSDEESVLDGADKTYVQLAVMDGKTVGHRICAVTDCTKPLVNYKNGRFCKDHLPLERTCGIIPCGRAVRAGARTCDLPAHAAWEESWVARFKRLSFAGVRRVIRRQQNIVNDQIHGNAGPALQADLPSLGETAGRDVVHTFRARSIYCLQTVQWSCGMPIGWGKCYKSESQPQVLTIMNDIWDRDPTRRPAFLAYDDACDLLRHIATQQPESPWLTETRLIVDAWHYVGHRATDALCRQYCNPAPADGSQPDLVRVEKDRNGNSHLTRAFNTETAEQLNAWLTGYEAQLRQMTDTSYDFFIHILMMVFAETIAGQIVAKGRGMDALQNDE